MKKLLTVILLTASIVYSQANITGKVIDKNGNPLAGANIVLVGTEFGGAADVHGKFTINKIPKGNYMLQASMIGYRKSKREIKVDDSDIKIVVQLERTDIEFDQVVVSAAKYEQSTLDLPVSAEVMNSEFISKKGIIQLDDALRYVPGVNVTLDQISIRGSSGYSRGAGTRVLTALDGIPIYTGDTGEIIWQLVPITDIKKIEVIKGAASSLYGSTALGGVVNVLTKNNSRTPVTYVRGYFGVYDKPYYSQWDWSGENRSFNRLTAAHSNSAGNLGYSVSLTRDENMGYRQSDWYKRYSSYFKVSYKFSDRSSMQILGLGFFQHRGTFNFWKDSRHALVPPDADQGQIVSSQRIIGGLKFNHKITGDWDLSVITSYYYSNWNDESESANNSKSELLRTEIQSAQKINESAKIIYGVELIRGLVTSNIFGNPTSVGFGGYFQAEYKFNFPLTVTLGARYDMTKLDTLKAYNDFSPKVGFNYKLSKDFILRASVGKGFRAPSLAEAFTSTNTSGISIKPNPSVAPESNYTAEFGVKKIFGNIAEIDAAVFHNDYYDMIEPTIDPADGNVFFENVTRARIQGGELGIKVNAPFIYSSFNVSYTYLWARDVENNRALKYRPRHLIYSSFTFAPSFYQFGVDFRYWSRVEEIDNELVELGLVKEGDRRTEVFVVDLRAGASLYNFNVPLNVYINVNNFLNYNYVEMIGNVSPIRNISLNLELIF